MAADMTADGTRYEVHGEAGPWVVLVHGLGLNRRMWREQIPALMPSYRVLAYDLAGHGDTPPRPKAPSLSGFSAQLVGLLDHLGIARAAVVGFSLGGMIARRFAMDRGDRLWALGILNSAHARSPEATAAIQVRVDRAREAGPSATVGAAMTRWFGEAFQSARPEVIEEVRGWILANDPAVYPGNYQVLVDGVDELIAPDPPISCPALVMTADDDPGQTPEMSRAIAAEIPGAELVVLPGLRHMGMVEAPDAYNGVLLPFLDAQRPG